MPGQSTQNLKSVNVVITGAGRGLGAALAIGLADLGCNVILCGRSLPALENVAGHIQARTGQPPRTVLLDLADVDSVAAATGQIVRDTPIVDVLINNGAMWMEYSEAPYIPSDVQTVMNSALTGTYLLIQSLLPALKRSERPDVVTIGSISGLLNVNLYTASVPFYMAKHGQAGMADGLRQMFLGTPVRSICIHPPWLRDISPLDPDWDDVPSFAKGESATNRDVFEAVTYAISCPRHITIASLIIDSDSHGIDFRSHRE